LQDRNARSFLLGGYHLFQPVYLGMKHAAMFERDQPVGNLADVNIVRDDDQRVSLCM
jgi:hypothetical protein